MKTTPLLESKSNVNYTQAKYFVLIAWVKEKKGESKINS